MENVLNYLNKVENIVAILWSFLMVGLHRWELPVLIPAFILSFYLAAFYLIQGKRAVQLVRDKSPLVQAFPLLLGLSSSLLVLGVLLRSLGFVEQFMATAGMVGLLISCLVLFYNPVQDEFLPVLKKVLLRIFLLIAVGFAFAV